MWGRELLKRLRSVVVVGAIRNAAISSVVTPISAVIIAPHPDDEVFGCGGTIALKRQLGVKVSVVFITSGEASHRDCCSTSPQTIALARKELAVAAGAELGLVREDFYWLSLPDGGIPRKGDSTYPAAMASLVEILSTLSPGEFFLPHPNDVWPDHVSTTEMVRSALAEIPSGDEIDLFYYPVWLWHSLRLSSLRNVMSADIQSIDIEPVSGKKRAAIEAYLNSNLSGCGKPISGVLPNGFLKHFNRDNELFWRLSDPG